MEGRSSNVDGHVSIQTKSPLYEPLYGRKIRLLRLLPGNYRDPLRCKLQTVDLQFKPEYEALSYTWANSNGDSSLSQQIYVGARQDILLITANCANALRRLRFASWSRNLWVDAICIDQCNIHERSHQVGIMRYIYATAERVIIYLGEDAEDPEKPSVPWKYENHGNTLDLSTDLRTQPYFTRVWVIQEVASARSAWILLGSKGARWEDFLKPPNTGDLVYRVKCIRNYDLLKAHHPWLQLVAQPKHRDLSELWGLLSATALCQASDPRDKVFALLGLFIGSGDAGLVPDYSISFSQVLCGLTALSFAQYPDSWGQIFAMARPNPLHDMPSWTVDWSKSTEMWLQIMNSKGTGSVSPEDNFLGPAKDTFARFFKDGSLVVKGVLVTSLIDCSLKTMDAPPGMIGGICHEPGFPIREREARLEASRWTRKDDKLYAVDGLSYELLILRPLKGTNKQSLVGICENFYTESSAELINLVDRKTALLFSIWNEVLDHRTEDWFIPQAWDDVAKVLAMIQTYGWFEMATPSTNPWVDPLEEGYEDPSKSPWRRQQGFDNMATSTSHTPDIAAWKSPLLRLRKDVEEDRHRRAQLRGGYTQPYLEDSCTLQMTPNVPGLQDQPGVNLANFLLPACWHYGEYAKYGEHYGSLREIMGRPKHRGYERSSPWHPDYMNSGLMEGFWRRLGRMLQSKVSYHKSGYESATDFLRRLVGQKLTHKSRDFDSLLRYYQAGKNCAPRLTRDEKLADEILLRWIRNSMELDPDASWTPGEHSSTAGNRSWAEDFYEMWETLSRRPRQVSHKPPSPMVFDGNPEEEGVMTEDFEEAIDAGKWILERGFEERAWGMLRDLAAETEKYLLPLREEFVKNRGVATCANKTNDMKWEDVYIV
ncbi:Heterokaryon incompatibility protein 6, OR allele [Colletotrichum siamense]|uniref:Heterokaryon incompatibility protein 6, OR allele n=1 Tax=Colletotrichum siamense TaxID=690259 RepID=UPI0018726FBE|nr:Heterokaryon incompatibility protein 6, OR allele [Colletotrichum siamense]KAF5510947.1 Heterokaryon incompatibility protein 6, OR allele [Colletotrichum siamense]